MELRMSLFLSSLFVHQINSNLEFPAHGDDLAKLGQLQYIRMNERTKLQNYGDCWKNAVNNLHEGCHNLNEEKQSDIALRFTDCFLRMSFHETCNCYNFEAVKRKECMQSMSSRAFNAYTEFYAHTQNICFYLKSQIWHEETEDTINRLSFASNKAATQLEELVDNSVNLKQALVDSHSNLKIMMAEFQMAAYEQQRLLFEVFDRLSSLQEWAVGEISWLDTVVFYLCGVIISHILTATPRTQSARFFLFLAFTVNIIAERYLCQCFLNIGTQKIDALNENLSWWVLFCRKILITVCILILSIAVIKYQDYNIINHQLLIQIQEQNQKLLGYLGKVNMLEHSVGLDQTGEIIDSDCEVLGEFTPQRYEPKTPIITPHKLPQSPRTTAAVLKKTEKVIQSALETSLNHIDVVHQLRRSVSPALSHISSRSSTPATSQRRRRQLDYDSGSARTRYNLRHLKIEEAED